MKPSFGKLFQIALFTAILLFFSITGFSQLTFRTVDAGPYTPGSTIAATFDIGSGSCIEQTNIFQLYLSDASGSFASEKLIGTYNGFYSTYINGIIPLGTPNGTGYKLRIKSTLPSFTSAASATFEIKTGSPVEAKIASSSYLSDLKNETFGTCDTKQDNTFFLTNESTIGASVLTTIKDELKTPSTPSHFSGETLVFKADLTHYTIFVKATMPDGTVGTKAYLLINNKTTTIFGSTGSNTICLPDNLEFPVDTSYPNGIGANFPGDVYTIDWGDSNTSTYTICEIIANGGMLKHNYVKSSCGNVITTSAGSAYNVFGVNIKLQNQFCGDIGTPVFTTAKVVRRPTNSFENRSPECANVKVLFTNTSDPGQNPNTTSAGCTDNIATYNWYVDDVLIAVNKPGSYNFEYIFTTHGKHKVRLQSTTNSACDAPDVEHEICIQNPPEPIFSLPTANFCAPFTLAPVDKSIVDNTCIDANTYNWVITPAVPTINGTTLQSKQPEFSFTNAGVYQISLQITTPSCGIISSAAQTVTVDGEPAAKLSPNVTLCNPTSYDFSDVTNGPTKTLLTGSPTPLPDTYTWFVASTGNYSFTKGDTHSQYPSIKFNDYATYTVTVVHKNGCGSVSATQVLDFKPAPTVDAGLDAGICFTENTFTLAGKISDPTVAHSWIGGNGVFSPDRNSLTPTYTPTALERATGIVPLILRATTGLAAPCNTIDDEVILTIRPNLDPTSATALNICSNEQLNYVPTNNVIGTAFLWTATGTPNASGFSASGSGPIKDVLINTNATTDALVTYTIIPTYSFCQGLPFTLVVTVSPLPIVTATVPKDSICSNTTTDIQLSSNLPNTIYSYTSSVIGSVTGNSNRAIPGLDSHINDVLINSGSTNATVTYTITPSVAGKCSGAPIQQKIIVYPAIPIANAGADVNLCSGNDIELSANDPQNGKGLWTLTSGQTGIVISDATLFNTKVTGLTPGQSYTFNWQITGSAPCGTSSDDVNITLYLPISNVISTLNTVICNGTKAIIVGDLPVGANGAFTFSWEKSIDNGVTWTAIAGEKNKDLSITLTATTLVRRLVNSNICTSFSNEISVMVHPPLDGNVITGDQTICFNAVSTAIIGSIPTGADGNYAYQWQNSTDNGANWTDISGASNQNISPLGITSDTWFRRVAKSISCGTEQNISNIAKIIFSPAAKAEFNTASDKGCSPFLLNATNIKSVNYPGNDIYTWYADNVLIGTGLSFPGFAITGGNKTVTIKLVVTSLKGCNIDTFSKTFSTYDVLSADFTQSLTSGCGPLNVSFKNTSTSLADATFSWDFGNGQKAAIADPGMIIFDSDPNGKDTTYTVTLTASTPCNTIVKTSTVMVKAKAIAVFSPDKTTACSPATINFSNTSPGNTNTYYFDFGDGTTSGPIIDKSSISHIYTTSVVKQYLVTMRAENSCGVDTSSFTITISPNNILPELVVNSSEKQGCAPFSVNFFNNTSGAKTFVYTFLNTTTGESSTTITQKSPAVLNHIFTTGGKYTVTLVATNDCSTASTSEEITVFKKPTLNFAANNTSGCNGLKVTFKNSAEDGVGYLWDFGDGKTSTDVSPTHIYSGVDTSFTVSLTATNPSGCTTTSTLPNYISLSAPSVADFTVKPGNAITIPNYTFTFSDNSVGGVGREWDFGDGVTSKVQNPVHLYPDTGIYRVNLKVYDEGGCASTTYQTVRIFGAPGFLYFPNSFMPGSAKEELQTFKAKGRGIEQYKLSIFDKWGLLIYETTDISDGAPAAGWDGTFNGVAQPQGVYFWKADVEFTNGSAWKGMSYNNGSGKKTGVIYLIR